MAARVGSEMSSAVKAILAGLRLTSADRAELVGRAIQQQLASIVVFHMIDGAERQPDDARSRCLGLFEQASLAKPEREL